MLNQIQRVQTTIAIRNNLAVLKLLVELLDDETATLDTMHEHDWHSKMAVKLDELKELIERLL